MRYLLISIATLLVASCASYPKKNNFEVTDISKTSISNPYFSDSQKDYVFKADISLYKKKISGILIIKKVGNLDHRVVFTTEMGNKIFDFLFSGTDFYVNYILKEIDKKIIINILRNDFGTLLNENAPIEVSYNWDNFTIHETRLKKKKHFYFYSNGHLEKIVRTSSGKEKVIFNFQDFNDGLFKNIQILHKNIKLTIQLKAI